jgi:hypothetical protein
VWSRHVQPACATRAARTQCRASPIHADAPLQLRTVDIHVCKRMLWHKVHGVVSHSCWTSAKRVGKRCCHPTQAHGTLPWYELATARDLVPRISAWSVRCARHCCVPLVSARFYLSTECATSCRPNVGTLLANCWSKSDRGPTVGQRADSTLPCTSRMRC